MLLNDKNMFDEWNRDVKTMAGRIIEMREALYDQLVNKLQTPGDWKHITNQIGMFSFTGLNPDQCKAMVDNAHIYMTGNGAYPEYVTCDTGSFADAAHRPHFDGRNQHEQC